jgi:cytochrome c-type biogenesis protein
MPDRGLYHYAGDQLSSALNRPHSLENVSYTAAFIAGLLSITSPCILPVIPLYIAYLIGTTDRESVSRRFLMLNALGFVIGFSLIFVLVGTAFGFLGTALAERKTLLVQIGGLLLVIFGLQQIGVISLPFMRRAPRVDSVDGNVSVVRSGVVGMTFAAGWTPCAGPILGAILTLALSQGDTGKATSLLSIYSLGLAIPFLLIALIGTSSALLQGVARRSGSITSLSGAVMLAVGVIMILGIYQNAFARIVSLAPWAPIEPSLS